MQSTATQHACRPDAPAFAPGEARVYIAAWPDDQAKIALLGWLWGRGFRLEHIHGYNLRDYARALNTVVLRDALPSGAEWIVLCDKDILPGPTRPGAPDATAAWLTAPGHVVGAEYPVHNPECYGDPACVHSGFLRVWSGVFRRIAPPWFADERNACGTEITQCVCEYFRRTVPAAGFRVVRAGGVNHEVK